MQEFAHKAHPLSMLGGIWIGLIWIWSGPTGLNQQPNQLYVCNGKKTQKMVVTHLVVT